MLKNISNTSIVRYHTDKICIAGKSTVIDLVAKWTTSILQKSGDSLDRPYVLLTAFTGTAASNIGGNTLTSAFNFGYGNKFTCISDRDRDQKRLEFKDLVVVIIDEISFVKADMLYMLSLKLQELKDNKKPFGGVAIFAFGDIFQLQPVAGRHVFAQPSNPEYYVTYRLDNLWEKLTVVNLTVNHRQGASGEFSELLNRARTLRKGAMEEADIKVWKSRVRPKGHKDLEGAEMNIICTRIVGSKMNKKYLTTVEGEEIKVTAVTYMSSQKKFTPPMHRSGDGTIADTHFMKELCLKIGAKVMMIKNVRTEDSLTNGQLGILVGVIKDKEGGVKSLMVKFKKTDAGRMTRRENPQLEVKYPGATKVEKALVQFSLKKGSSAKGNLIQFPIVLAHAVTVHKSMGMTIYKPLTATMDIMSTFDAAQGFVGASRTQELSQLFFVDEFDPNKMYASPAALRAVQDMDAR